MRYKDGSLAIVACGIRRTCHDPFSLSNKVCFQPDFRDMSEQLKVVTQTYVHKLLLSSCHHRPARACSVMLVVVVSSNAQLPAVCNSATLLKEKLKEVEVQVSPTWYVRRRSEALSHPLHSRICTVLYASAHPLSCYTWHHCQAGDPILSLLVLLCRDAAAEAAMELSWPGTVHLICEWHFIKNVKEKLKSRLGTAWKASATPTPWKSTVKCMSTAVGNW
jgi:hypothetical protein